MNHKLRGVMVQLKKLVQQPSTKTSLQRLQETFDTANPLAKWVAPAQTVCNYWNYCLDAAPGAPHRARPGRVRPAGRARRRDGRADREQLRAGAARRLLGHPGERPDRAGRRSAAEPPAEHVRAASTSRSSTGTPTRRRASRTTWSATTPASSASPASRRTTTSTPTARPARPATRSATSPRPARRKSNPAQVLAEPARLPRHHRRLLERRTATRELKDTPNPLPPAMRPGSTSASPTT